MALATGSVHQRPSHHHGAGALCFQGPPDMVALARACGQSCRKWPV